MRTPNTNQGGRLHVAVFALALLAHVSTASQREVGAILGFSRSAFQRFQSEPTNQREQSDMDVLPMVITTFHRHRRR